MAGLSSNSMESGKLFWTQRLTIMSGMGKVGKEQKRQRLRSLCIVWKAAGRVSSDGIVKHNVSKRERKDLQGGWKRQSLTAVGGKSPLACYWKLACDVEVA